MKLAKALKEKKRLAAEVAHLKNKINSYNSYIKDSNVPQKFNVIEMYSTLQSKVQNLVNLKIVINEANKEIQPLIFLLSEYKAMIAFLNILNTREGIEPASFSKGEVFHEVQIDALEKENLIKEFQDKADNIQDKIDTYNYTTEVSWNEIIDDNQ
ncbi:MAG: hypothetical protein ACOC3V_00260 [bacterium]